MMFRKTVLLECIDGWYQTKLYGPLSNDFLNCLVQFSMYELHTFYYAGIMLNAFSDPLCSIFYWHNRLVPTQGQRHRPPSSLKQRPCPYCNCNI